MNVSPVPFLFWTTFLLLLTLCGLVHFHGPKGLIASAIGAAIIVLLTQRWWKRGFQPVVRSKASFRDPSLGSRAQRREAQRRYEKRNAEKLHGEKSHAENRRQK